MGRRPPQLDVDPQAPQQGVLFGATATRLPCVAAESTPWAVSLGWEGEHRTRGPPRPGSWGQNGCGAPVPRVPPESSRLRSRQPRYAAGPSQRRGPGLRAPQGRCAGQPAEAPATARRASPGRAPSRTSRRWTDTCEAGKHAPEPTAPQQVTLHSCQRQAVVRGHARARLPLVWANRPVILTIRTTPRQKAVWVYS